MCVHVTDVSQRHGKQAACSKISRLTLADVVLSLPPGHVAVVSQLTKRRGRGAVEVNSI